jgi:hypothetical protein
MKHMQVLKRAWHILWNYRALWVFGIILALTTASINNSSSYQTSGEEIRGYELNMEEPILPQLVDVVEEVIEEGRAELDLMPAGDYEDRFGYQIFRAILWFAGVLLVLVIVGKVFRYVAENALIKMVDEYEDSGEKRTVRQGFRLGWSREAWRIFLADLVIEIPFAFSVILIVMLVLIPIFAYAGDDTAARLVTMLTGIGLAMLLGLLLLAVRAVLFVIKPLIRREIVLNQATVGQGIGQGFRLARQYWKETGLMGLILFGVNIVWPLFLLPIILVSIAVAGMLGVGAALLIGGSAYTTGDPAMFWGIFIGLGLFVLLLSIPIGFFTGLMDTYQSSVWTLTYREVKALKSLENGDEPELEVSAAAT